MAAPWQQAAQAQGVHVFGAGGFARDLARALQAQGVVVHGFATSAAPAQAQLDGLPVRRLDQLPVDGAALWIGVFNREAHSDYGQLQHSLTAAWPARPLVWPQQAYAWLQLALGFRFWLQDPAALAAAQVDIDQARAQLDDETSRQAFDSVLAFRSDPSAFARPPTPQPGPQYLPDWLCAHLKSQATGQLALVDGGAYQGETLLELAQHLPVDQAWTFEPDATNYRALVQRLADWPGQATHVPAGLSDACGSAGFSGGQGEASHLGQGPAVPVVTIDSCLHQAPVNFIKLDVEGHELAALRGARATLQRQRPVLAVAAYHRWDDLWRLPLFLQQTVPGYRLRLGLHGHNSFDTVLYAF